MNIRILRMTERHPFIAGLRSVPGLGQLQPVNFSTRQDGAVVLSCEGMAMRHGREQWCLWRLPLPHTKAQAKALFAELERCKAEKIDTPAHAAWKAYLAKKKSKVAVD